MSKEIKRLILAYPRSGTTSLLRFINKHDGISMGHEGKGNCCDGDISFLEINNHKKFDIVIHIVRNPIDTISSSLVRLADRSLRQLCELTGHARYHYRLHTIMQTWYLFNDMAEQITQVRFNIENLENEYKSFCEHLEIKPHNFHIEKKYNHTPHPDLLMKDFENQDKNLAFKIKQKAIFYGYSRDRYE